MATTTRIRLYGYVDNFAEGSRPIRALLFGEMVRRAMPVMHEYQSDLFHDALWIEEYVNGPTTFDWLIRPSGTNLSTHPDPSQNMARIGVRIGAGDGAVFYVVNVDVDRGMWFATFTEIPLAEVETR